MNAFAEAPRRLMLEPDAAALLVGHGIDYVSHEVVTTPEEAALAAARIGFPVALKVVSPDVVHKSDVGGVVLDVKDETDAHARFEDLVSGVKARVPGAHIAGVLVCRQVAGPRVELIVGGLRDATFGPVVMVGAGGVFAEILGDVAFRLAPLPDDECLDMLGGLRVSRALAGYRDLPPLDVAALARAVSALGDLLQGHPEIAEVDLNPVLVQPEGCMVVDARIITAAP